METLYVQRLAKGPGRTIVASHALGLDHRMWAGWARHLEGRHSLLAFDHRGHGGSVPMGSQTLHDLCDEVAAHLARWVDGPVVFVGLSMGGMVGQGLALLHPSRVHALVLAHTVARYDADARQAWATRIDAVRRGGMAAVVDTVVQRYLHDAARAADPEAAQRLRESLLAMRPQDYAAACEMVVAVDWLDWLPRIRVPTLVLAGALDAGAPPAQAERLARAIGAAQLVVVEGASHLSPWEQPAAFFHHLDHFLEQHA